MMVQNSEHVDMDVFYYAIPKFLRSYLKAKEAPEKNGHQKFSCLLVVHNTSLRLLFLPNLCIQTLHVVNGAFENQ